LDSWRKFNTEIADANFDLNIVNENPLVKILKKYVNDHFYEEHIFKKIDVKYDQMENDDKEK